MKSLVCCSLLVALCTALPFAIRDPTREASIEEPEETFRRSDGDHNGALTFDDSTRLDADKDGQVTHAEYEAHYQKEKQDADGLRAEIFEDFDADFDLKLSREEVERVLEKRRSSTPFDSNHDGGLDLEEYIQFDSKLPFHELDPIVEQTTAEAPLPMKSFKEEKLPMMKQKKMDIE
ncbi:hypothetical protein M3Y99_00204100 [Aphelenchoides fujianensis]|nr:hypothetical protein M3Y99_00204100 [Aphelenchoides fujianensis]